MATSVINGAYAYIWTYRVWPESREAFAKAYGPNGEWVRFYAQSDNYIRTDLLIDEKNPDRFSTIDYFKTKESRDGLVRARKQKFDEIDQRWDEATIEEEFVGFFKVNSSE